MDSSSKYPTVIRATAPISNSIDIQKNIISKGEVKVTLPILGENIQHVDFGPQKMGVISSKPLVGETSNDKISIVSIVVDPPPNVSNTCKSNKKVSKQTRIVSPMRV
ncbi:hypothetical protein ACOSQ3_009689 [Xanthoceras sorbifolium]